MNLFLNIIFLSGVTVAIVITMFLAIFVALGIFIYFKFPADKYDLAEPYTGVK